jgi:hypothetical protein
VNEREALNLVLADFRRTVHTGFPARVLAYDVAAQTVDVRPAIQRERPTDVVDTPVAFEALPDLFAVPVQWPRAGGGALTFPIAIGDWVEVCCAEQSLAAWREQGGTGKTPGLNDPHGLNGAIAKTGWYPDTELLSGVSATNVELRAPTGGSVVLGGLTDAQFVAIAALVDARLASIVTWANTHTHATEGATGLPLLAGQASVAATKVKAL